MVMFTMLLGGIIGTFVSKDKIKGFAIGALLVYVLMVVI